MTRADSTLVLDDVEMECGDSVNVSAAAEGALGITASIDGKDVEVRGFTILLSGLDVGSHVLNVTTLPDEDHNPVTRIVNVAVKRIKTQLSASPITTTYKANKYLVISLKDSKGNALSGVEVSVNLGGVRTYVTDAGGQVMISTKNLAAKVYTAEIVFNGNAYCDGSSKDVRVTVNKASNPLKVKAKTVKVKFKKLKKKAQRLKVSKVVKFTKKG